MTDSTIREAELIKCIDLLRGACWNQWNGRHQECHDVLQQLDAVLAKLPDLSDQPRCRDGEGESEAVERLYREFEGWWSESAHCKDALRKAFRAGLSQPVNGFHRDGCECPHCEDARNERENADQEKPAACRHCKNPLLKSNRTLADGCPCNSHRGINHGLVPRIVCTCPECDQDNTGCSRFRSQKEQTTVGECGHCKKTIFDSQRCHWGEGLWMHAECWKKRQSSYPEFPDNSPKPPPASDEKRQHRWSCPCYGTNPLMECSCGTSAYNAGLERGIAIGLAEVLEKERVEYASAKVIVDWHTPISITSQPAFLRDFVEQLKKSGGGE